MKFYSQIEQELISAFTGKLHEEFKKQYKGTVHFDLLRDSEDDRYFDCHVTFMYKGYAIYRTQFKVAWLAFTEGIPYELLAEQGCTAFKKWILDRYFFKK